MKKFLTMVFVFFCLFTYGASAENEYNEQLDASGADELYEILPDDSKQLLGNAGINDISPEAIFSLTPGKVFSLLIATINNKITAPFKALLSIIAVILLCALIEGMNSTIEEKSMNNVFNMIATLCISSIIIVPLVNAINEVASAINTCGEFMLIFIPVFAAVMIAGGQVVTAGSYQVIALSAAQLIVAIARNLIMPVLSIYLAFTISSSVSGGSLNLQKIGESFKKFAVWVLTFIATVFTGILTIQGVVGTATDTATTKATKFAVSSMVPAVGSALGDAISSVQSSIRILKSSVGVFGIIAPLVILLPVFINVVLWIFAVRVGSTISLSFNLKNLSKLLESIGSVLGLLLSILLVCLLIMTVTTTIMLMIGGGG